MHMSDMGEDFRLMREASQEKRASNRSNGERLLIESGISFESRNDGAHLIVTCENGIIDFWPGTGKFITRKWRGGYNLTGRGVRKVIELAKSH